MFEKGYWKGNKIKNMSVDYIKNCINYLKKHPLCDENLECYGDGADMEDICCIKHLTPNEELTNNKIKEFEEILGDKENE